MKDEYENIEDDPSFWVMLFNFGRRLYAHGSVEARMQWRKNYNDYIHSKPWKSKAQAALLRAGFRCQLCNSDKKLSVHHRTYDRLGNEDVSDLTVLCNDCHAKFHGKDGE